FNRRAFLDFDPNEYTQTTINLGRQLFFDPGLSSTGTMSCATCHKPEKGFSDGLPKSKSLSGGHLDRNAPGLMNSVLAGSFFYDLRAEHLSQQFEHVITNQEEFNTTLLTIFSYLEGGEYRAMFVSAFPNHAANPVNPYTFKTALSAYLHSLTGYNSPFDRFMRHESAKLDKDVIAGYNLFMGKAACATCHFPPTFSGLLPPLFDDSESEVLGVPKDEKYTAIDPDMGRYSLSRIKEAVDFYKHSFKTVSVRNVSKTAPYMHNGVFDDLKDVVEFYNNGGGLGHQLDVPYQTLAGDSLDLSKKEQKQLIRFMEALEEPEMR
ncbi:MAG: cytochrome-c peroxidase, partial [Bacteroidetes bacterium]|nr:cytochrome-c peroxidase [Bacteroidota bacterium]